MTHESLHNFVHQKGEREFNPKETLQVLTLNRMTYWSWGVSKLINMFNKGLCLKVSGHHHKGWVVITLGWTDTYSVYYLSNKGEIKQLIRSTPKHYFFQVMKHKPGQSLPLKIMTRPQPHDSLLGAEFRWPHRRNRAGW